MAVIASRRTFAERWDYPQLTKEAKRQILGLNSAKLYDLPANSRRYDDGALPSYATRPALQPGGRIDTVLTGVGYPTPVVPADTQQSRDRFAKIRGWAQEKTLGRSDTRFGWIRKT